MSDSGTSAKVDQPATPGQSAPRPDDVGTIARDWWRSLQPDTQLRRPGEREPLPCCVRPSPLEGGMQEATFRLFHQLRKVRRACRARSCRAWQRLPPCSRISARMNRAQPSPAPWAPPNSIRATAPRAQPLRFERPGLPPMARMRLPVPTAERSRSSAARLTSSICARTVFFGSRGNCRHLAFAYYGAFAAPGSGLRALAQ